MLTVKRKGVSILVQQISVYELDKTKCSKKFLSHNLSDTTLVYIKCNEDGTFDLRGKKQEYRIIVPDKENYDCPECGEPIIALWSGVKCSKCTYWFCY